MPHSGNAARSATIEIDRPRHLVGLPQRLTRISTGAAAVTSAIGTIVIVGYLVRSQKAVEIYPTLPPMYLTTAICFLVGGLAALGATSASPRRRLEGAVGYGAIGTYALTTLWLHVVDADPTFLDLWPHADFVEATTPVPGRPVAETCVAFVCISFAGLLLALRRWARLSQALALGCLTVGVAAIIGFTIGVDRRALGTSFVSVGMALHTAVALSSLGLSVMLAQPTVGIFGRLTHSGASARLNRRLVLAVVIGPVVITGLTAALQQALPDARLAQSVAAVAQILALAILVMLPLGAVEQVEDAATEALLAARQATEGAGERHAVLASITEQLTVPPVAPDGWNLAVRQAVAFAALPGDSCQVLANADDSRFLVAIIDVAGHGTEPALQALRLRTEAAALWRAGRNLVQISDVLDSSVNEMSTIATGLLIAVDRYTGDCEYLNAGHPAALAQQESGVERWAPTQPLFGYSLGQAKVVRRSLARHAIAVAYTDGITEARSLDRSLLGDSHITEAISLHGAVTVDLVADACMDAALAHQDGRLRDDALVVVLQRR